MAEDEVLVVLDAALTVQVDVEQLALIQRLRDAGRVSKHLNGTKYTT